MTVKSSLVNINTERKFYLKKYFYKWSSEQKYGVVRNKTQHSDFFYTDNTIEKTLCYILFRTLFAHRFVRIRFNTSLLCPRSRMLYVGIHICMISLLKSTVLYGFKHVKSFFQSNIWFGLGATSNFINGEFELCNTLKYTADISEHIDDASRSFI